MQDISAIVAQLITPTGVFFLLVGIIWALIKGHIVTGREYTEMKAERDRWRDAATIGTKLASRAVDVAERPPT